MNDDYYRKQAEVVRKMADNADPFTRKRLLALAENYEGRLGRPSRATRTLQTVAIDSQDRPHHHDGGGSPN